MKAGIVIGLWFSLACAACSDTVRNFDGSDGVGGEGGSVPASGGSTGAKSGEAGDGDVGEAGLGNAAGGENGGSAGQDVDAGGRSGNDGEAGSPSDSPLAIEATSLPDAGIHVAYRAKLFAVGGSAVPTFEIADGSLPPGISLSDDGMISGTPTETGTFPFSVTARDREGASASADLELEVYRKRWLAFVANADSPSQNLLYVADVANELMPKTLLSTGVQPDGNVEPGDYRFSADGSRLAFSVDKSVDGEKELFVVELSASQPSSSLPVDEQRNVGGFGLAPDGQGIAYHIAVGPAEFELRYVDLSGTFPTAPITIGPSDGKTVLFVSNDRIVYGGVDGNLSVVREGEDFGVAEALQPGVVSALDWPTRRLVVSSPAQNCKKMAWLYDFSRSTSVYSAPAGEGDGWPEYDPWLNFVSSPDGAGETAIFASDATSGEALGTIASSYDCNNTSIWSPRGTGLVLMDDDSRLVYASLSEAGVEAFPVGGDYGWVGGAVAFVNEERFVFTDGDRLFESHLNVFGEPTDAVAIAASSEDSPFSMGHPRTAPDGSGVFFVAQTDQVLFLPGPFAIDLRGATPSAPRLLIPPSEQLPSDGAPGEPGLPSRNPSWSSDSSRVAFAVVEDTGGSDMPTWLMVADMLSASALAQPLTSSSCQAELPLTCRKVRSFLFQP